MEHPTSFDCCQEGTTASSDEDKPRLSASSAFFLKLPGRAERKSFSCCLDGLEEEEEEEGPLSAAGSASGLRVMPCKTKEPCLRAQDPLSKET